MWIVVKTGERISAAGPANSQYEDELLFESNDYNEAVQFFEEHYIDWELTGQLSKTYSCCGSRWNIYVNNL